MWKLCKEFCRTSSAHGLQLMVSKRKSAKERTFWGCLFSVTILLVSCHFIYLGYFMIHSPVEMIVSNPNYDLENVDFPAITVCPNSKVMKSRLHQLIAKKPELNSEELQDQFCNTVKAMDLLKYPFYHHPNIFIESFKNRSVYPIPNKQIYCVMRKVRPKLQDIFQNCRWRGLPLQCDQLFRKQTTEEGFCYSFNSKTADRSFEDYPMVPPIELPDGSLECFRNNAAGRGSGLSFDLKSLDNDHISDNLINKGYSVMVHDPSTLPDVSLKLPVYWKHDSFSRISVAVRSVKAHNNLYRITEDTRGCQLDNVIDINSCQIACRKDEILKECNCLPYFMYHKNLRLRNPQKEGEKYDSPTWSIPESMNCSCVSPCAYNTYLSQVAYVPLDELDGNLVSSRSMGSVEVVYKNHFATSYIKRAHYSISTFLVEGGGVASLFLGCSVITVVELVLFLYKLVKECYFDLFVKSSVVQPFVQ